MNWINIETATLDSEEFVGSNPIERATWLCLLRFCAGQENGGVIKNCRTWPDRKWQQLARVLQTEIEVESNLWKWIGDDLHLWNYPVDKEKEIQSKREAGRKGGSSKSQAKIEAVRINGAKHHQSISKAEAKQEPNGKERKGKEEKGIEDKTEAQSVAEVSATSVTDWLKELQSQPAYQQIDVAREFSKMQTWCATNNKHATRRRFVNWLNRAEKPLSNTQPRFTLESRIDRS